MRALLYIAQRPGEVISVSELVYALKMHRAFLRRILQILSKHKVLKSLKGKGGGFILHKRPDRVKVIDIIKIFRGRVNVMSCLLEKDVCPHPDNCVLMGKMKDIERQIYKALTTTTIAALIKSKR